MGTGFIKCMPMILSGRFVFDAIFVIEIDDVFDASITPERVIRSKVSKTFDLVLTSSITASMTKSASESFECWVVAVIRDKAALLSSAVIRTFATSRSRFFEIVDSARSRNCSARS